MWGGGGEKENRGKRMRGGMGGCNYLGQRLAHREGRKGGGFIYVFGGGFFFFFVILCGGILVSISLRRGWCREWCVIGGGERRGKRRCFVFFCVWGLVFFGHCFFFLYFLERSSPCALFDRVTY